MKKLFITVALAIMAMSANAQTSTTTVTTTPPVATTTGNGQNQMATNVDAKNEINVTSMSMMGGKGVSHSMPMAVQPQTPMLATGPAPDIETLVQRVDLVFDHFCSGDIPAGINRRLHRDDTEKGDSGNTSVTFAPRGALFATYADRSARKASVKHLEMIGFDASGRMRVRTGRDSDGKDLEMYCLGDLGVKATISDMDKVTNQTVRNDADLYLADRGYFDEYTLVSVGLLTRTAPGAVYSTGTGWGASGSGAAMPVTTLLGALFGFSKNVGITGATARPEARFYAVYNCTDKDNATCTKLRESGVKPVKLSALHGVIMSQFVNGDMPNANKVQENIDKIAADQQKLAQAVGHMAQLGQALEIRVAKAETCTTCGAAAPVAKPAPAPAKATPVKKQAPKPAPAPVVDKCKKAESIISNASNILAVCPATPAAPAKK